MGKKFAKGSRPDFFVVGAPKCATSAIADYLAAHPQIFMARKEMHFFGDDLQFASNFYRRNEREYLAEFSGWSGQLRAGEASVWYLFSTRAAAEIKAFNPDARIIIMLRDPAEMLHSLYYSFRADCNEHLPTFRAALAAQDDRRFRRQVSRSTYLRQGLIYDEVPRYTEQIRRYFKLFGRERVHIVTYDDFSSKTKATFAGVLDFLEVDSSRIGNSFPVINGNHSLKSPLLKTIMSDPLIRGTAIAMRSWLPAPAFAALQEIESWIMKSNVRHQKRPRLEPDLWVNLKHQFAPEVERLSELLGRNLTHWNNPELPAAAPSVRFDVVSNPQITSEPVFKMPKQGARIVG